MARAKKRGFVDRILGTYCTNFNNKHKRNSRITNKKIRRKLKRLLIKEINNIAE